MKVLLPELLEDVEIDLPGIEAYIYRGGEVPEAFREAPFVVAPFGRRAFEPLVAQLRSPQVIQTLSAGVDWILDLVPPGAVLCDARGVHDIPMAEHMVGLILASVKRFPEFRDAQREARWQPLPLDDLEGAKVLLVGYGSIAEATEQRLLPFGVEILRVARHPRPGVAGPEALERLLPQADVVILLLPLTPETQGIADRSFFQRMKPGALFINGGRGKLVDTEALREALEAGHIRAALDVVDPEPLPKEHPLWRAPGLFLTPHVGGGISRPKFKKQKK
jgi:phosphoglycerate dehydrogenase-like enzyme